MGRLLVQKEVQQAAVTLRLEEQREVEVFKSRSLHEGFGD